MAARLVVLRERLDRLLVEAPQGVVPRLRDLAHQEVQNLAVRPTEIHPVVLQLAAILQEVPAIMGTQATGKGHGMSIHLRVTILKGPMIYPTEMIRAGKIQRVPMPTTKYTSQPLWSSGRCLP